MELKEKGTSKDEEEKKELIKFTVEKQLKTVKDLSFIFDHKIK